MASGTHNPARLEWSAREREVLDLIARGRTNGEIAGQLEISFATAKWHVSELITKLGVSSREEVAEYWQRERSLRRSIGRLMHAVVGLSALKVAAGGATVAGLAVVGGAAWAAFAGGNASPDAPVTAAAASRTPATFARTYTVVAGDTLAGIANRYGTTSSSILALNPGVTRDTLQVGQVLNFPPASAPGSLKASPTNDGEEITVQVYRGSMRGGSPDCYDILADMVPSVAMATAPGEPMKCQLGKSGRLTFLEDDHGVRFLDGVELLLVATTALPQPYHYSQCGDLRPYLVPASPKADPSAHILVCDVQPLPRGANPGNRITITARLPENAAPATIPADTRCWELTRYLGGAVEVKTVPVSCVLD